MRTRVLAGICCTVSLFAAACGGDTDVGEPNAGASDSDAAQPSNAVKYGAPSVPEPLDVERIINHPCGALTKKQIAQFPGTLDDTQVSDTTLTGEGQSCGWIFQGDRYSLGSVTGGIVLPSSQYHGISSVYKAEKDGNYDTFQPFEAAGYPAVVNNDKDSTGEGECRVSVGLRDDTAYRISTLLDTDHPNYDDPCKPVKKLASFVVENLKEGK